MYSSREWRTACGVTNPGPLDHKRSRNSHPCFFRKTVKFTAPLFGKEIRRMVMYKEITIAPKTSGELNFRAIVFLGRNNTLKKTENGAWRHRPQGYKRSPRPRDHKRSPKFPSVLLLENCFRGAIIWEGDSQNGDAAVSVCCEKSIAVATRDENPVSVSYEGDSQNGDVCAYLFASGRDGVGGGELNFSLMQMLAVPFFRGCFRVSKISIAVATSDVKSVSVSYVLEWALGVLRCKEDTHKGVAQM
ncbi:hypothetical protein CEXT_723891 [Caerostris extrusa]|uniref:Uncharacterized protein n=1 Tax=Caerostris extrusa TaxID=172846 RepID=A0AAV4M5K6_CAEEX|nr:hypothetical protein CEXT_723891 [Caerostris extrusa]